MNRPGLDAAFRAGVEAWPGVAVASDAFAARVRQAGDGSAAQLHLEDLYLVTALENGDERAWQVFRDAYRPWVTRALMRVLPTKAQRDEVADELFASLIMPRAGAEGVPLNTYTGRGSLKGWVQITAVRRVYRAARDRQRGIAPGRMVETPIATDGDPATHAVDAELLTRLESALRAGIGALPEASRTLLQLRYQRHYSLDELGAVYGQDKSTLSKRLKALAGQLRTAIDQRLESDAGVRVDDLDDVWKRLDRVAPGGLDRWLGASA